MLCLRATFTESPLTPTTDPAQPLSNEGYSIILSSALLVIAGLWWLGCACRRQWTWRPVGSGLGILLFALAAGVGIKVASHTRNAVTDAVTMLAAMAAGLVLVQLLDRPHRVRITLAVLVALGAVQLYQCSEQATAGNAMLIEQYEKDPAGQLSTLGIEPGSFQHSLYEHRLYSKDIRGFFLTSNSAGSFLLLCLAAAMALAVQTRSIEPRLQSRAGAGPVGPDDPGDPGGDGDHLQQRRDWRDGHRRGALSGVAMVRRLDLPTADNPDNRDCV